MRKYLFVLLALLFTYASVSHAELKTGQYLTYAEVITALEEIAKNSLEKSEVLKREFARLRESHGIANNDEVYREFVRVRTAFEATRDSGLWQLRWDVTNNEPNSDSIWHQWDVITNLKYSDEEGLEPTATAECDELSALFAFISRGLGVNKVGLFWPTWNHTVAVWTTVDKHGKPVRVVVPTSQIFISKHATLGTNEFNPYDQKYIYTYSRKDIQMEHKIPIKLAQMMIRQVQKYGSRSSSYLQDRRNRLSNLFGGS